MNANSSNSNFNVRNVNTSGSLNNNDLCNVNSDGNTNGNSNSNGLRLVAPITPEGIYLKDIYEKKNNYLFLGRTTNNKKGNYREKGRKIKRRYKDYQKDSILLYSMVGTILSYRN